jgi:2-keto-3-deoxy-L-rhamnonate aldolase RhmA
MRGSQLRDQLRAGRPILNTGVTFHSPPVVEMLGYAGVDSIFLDGEHGPFGPLEAEEMIRAADLVDKPVLVRVPVNEEPVILRFLDVGASGIIAPHVTTREDAERAVRAVKYAPEGRRSLAGGRASAYGTRESTIEYVRRANRETVVVGLFEDVGGLPNLPGILGVPGLDALIIGPNDLAGSMGYAGDPGRPDVQRVVDQIIAECRRANIPTGLPANDLDGARRNVERGAQIVTINVSAILINATRRLIAALNNE